VSPTISSLPPPSSSTSYSSRRIVQLPTVCPFESCANNLTKLVNLLAASYLLSSTPPASSPPSSLTSYSSRRIVQLPTVCRSESCANNLTKLVDLLVASYLLSSKPPASSSTSYSSRLTCYHPRCRHLHRHRTRRVLLAIIHAAGILIDIVLVASHLLSSTPPASSPPSYSSRRIVQLPTVCRSESCANNLTKLVDLLAASYLQSSKPPASSSTSYSSRLTCYHPRCWHTH